MPCVIISHTVSRPAPSPQGFMPLPSTETAPPAALSGSQAELQAALSQISQGLQLSRASTMALMRLQLAIRAGERLQAMEAMDRLDTLDAELERIISRLPSPANDDPAWQALAKHLDDQKLALAFEKLALASGIIGPDLVSIEHAWPDAPAGQQDAAAADAEEDRAPGENSDLPDLSALRPPAEEFEPARSRGISPAVYGFVLTLLVIAAIAGATWMTM